VIKTVALVLVAGLLGGTGHVLLSKGMKTVGDLTEAPAARVGGMVLSAITNPWLLLGVIVHIISFLFSTLLLIVAVIAVVWALRVLL